MAITFIALVSSDADGVDDDEVVLGLGVGGDALQVVGLK